MAGNNPVFSRIEKRLQDEQGYAGFGQQPQRPGQPQQGYGQQGSTPAGSPSTTSS